LKLALIDLIVESRQTFILGLTEHILGQEVCLLFEKDACDG
jgi:hypothetical protein